MTPLQTLRERLADTVNDDGETLPHVMLTRAEAEAVVAELDTANFSERNRRRCESPNGFNHALSSWSLSDWTTAVTGELGEAANIVKKLNRVRDGIPGNRESEDELRANLADEIADTVIYLDLLAQAAGFDLSTIRDAKFAFGGT